MKHIHTFESFINESSNITVPSLSDVDHTRLIKWMGDQFNAGSYSIKKDGKGFVIDTRKLSKGEIESLNSYLKSQLYIDESAFLEGAMADIHLMAQEAKNEEDFVKKFLAEYGDKIKDNASTRSWLKELYADTKK